MQSRGTLVYNPAMQVITLTTDFGTRDGFVGTMKRVIAGLAPKASVIDLTHVRGVRP